MHILEGHKLSVVGNHIGCPGFSDHIQIFVGDGSSLIERDTERFELLLDPTYADSEDETSAAHLINVGRNFYCL